MGPRLLVRDGEACWTHTISKEAETVGRSAEADLRLQDPACSRAHLRLLWRNGEVFFVDLGSANGTRLNGRTAGQGTLRDGDVLEVGMARLSFQRGRARAPRRGGPGWVAAALGMAAAAGLIFWPRARPEAPTPSTAPAPPAPASTPPHAGTDAGAAARLSAREALDTARAQREQAQEARFQAGLAEADAERRKGDLAAARFHLASCLDGGIPPQRLKDLQAALRGLDVEMETQYEGCTAEALRLARAGRFGEARALLSDLRRRFADLPWGSLAIVRLSELDAMEAKALERQRIDAEARRSEEERARRRADWAAEQRRFTGLVRAFPAGGKKAREDSFSAILACDPAVGQEVLDALADAERRLLDALRAALDSRAVQSLKQNLLGRLAERRKDALALILDAVRYPYRHGQADPYGPDGPKVQREVNALVKAVEDLYRPAGETIARLKALEGFRGVVDGLEEVESYRARLGRPARPEDSMKSVLDRAMGGTDFAREAAAERGNAAILAANEAEAARMRAEGSLDAEEAACILATNLYRVMMGLKPLRIDRRLAKASRAHSRDMAARGYFDHADPDGRGPGERAKAAGLGFGSVGENLTIRPTPEEAVVSWRQSSGHHRNLLGPDYEIIGVGREGNRWTMMLAKEIGR